VLRRCIRIDSKHLLLDFSRVGPSFGHRITHTLLDTASSRVISRHADVDITIETPVYTPRVSYDEVCG